MGEPHQINYPATSNEFFLISMHSSSCCKQKNFDEKSEFMTFQKIDNRLIRLNPPASRTSSDCQNISLYESEQSLSLSQDEGEQC